MTCPHGRTMHVLSERGCAGTWLTCSCCKSNFCDPRGTATDCGTCRTPEETVARELEYERLLRG